MDLKAKLVELLSQYFDIGDSYAYNLTRVKTAFGVGTMSLDDFEEFDDEVVADIADHLIANGVTVQELDGCEYCKEDNEGYRKMNGAFSITNPFHGSVWNIETCHCKPRRIYFCPMCGRKLPNCGARTMISVPTEKEEPMTEKVKLTALVEKSLLAHAGKTCKLAENIREKLTELICKFCNGLSVADITPPYGYENLADHLIANGVTVLTPDEDRNIYTAQEIEELQGEAYDLGVESVLHNRFGLSWHDAEEVRKEVAKLQTTFEWIPVSEPPKEKINCIVHYKHAYCDSDGYFAIDCAFYDGDKFQLDPAYKATHWMPLPQPPKGDS